MVKLACLFWGERPIRGQYHYFFFIQVLFSPNKLRLFLLDSWQIVLRMDADFKNACHIGIKSEVQAAWIALVDPDSFCIRLLPFMMFFRWLLVKKWSVYSKVSFALILNLHLCWQLNLLQVNFAKDWMLVKDFDYALLLGQANMLVAIVD